MSEVALGLLSNAVKTITCSKLECGRGFSVMNIGITKLPTERTLSKGFAAIFTSCNAP